MGEKNIYALSKTCMTSTECLSTRLLALIDEKVISLLEEVALSDLRC